jgi:hypothetical protein
LHGLGLQGHVGEPRESALERRGRRPPERAADRDAFIDARAALAVANATRLELLGELAAHPDAEDDAAAREPIERGDLLGGDRRMSESEEVHARADPDASGQRRHVGERPQRIERRIVERDVVPDPDRLESDRLRPHRHRTEQFGPVRDLDAEAEGHPMG